MDSILKQMEDNGYVKKSGKGYRSTSKAHYTILEDRLIVEHFAQVWRKLVNYYSGCTNLKYIYSLLYISCAMTLSHRHRSTTKKIFSKHRKTLQVFDGDFSTSFIRRGEI